MTELNFKGKEFVFNHHLAVPFRPLVSHKDKSIGSAELSDNLIIQGDNLHALKALLPIYAGKVGCVFIDPPYNTGNEGWCYNDNVNAPMIKEWFDENPVGTDDALRHDKWCAMMWPRIRLLHELLAEDGIFLMHIDENELERATAIIDEIFGNDPDNPEKTNRLGSIIWDKGNPKGDAQGISYQHEFIIVATRNRTKTLAKRPLKRLKKNAEKMIKAGKRFYKKIGKKTLPDDLDRLIKKYDLKFDVSSFVKRYDNDDAATEYCNWVKNQNSLSGGEKPYDKLDINGDVYRPVHMGWPNSKPAPEEYFSPINHPITGKKCPTPKQGWIYPPDTILKLMGDEEPVFEPLGYIRVGELVFGPDETTQPQKKYRLKDYLSENLPSIIRYASSDDNFLKSIGIEFQNAKPHRFITELIQAFTRDDDIVLDSFAGSGTIGHAVFLANRFDDGKRRFILVQMDEGNGKANAEVPTAKRIQCVVEGVNGVDNDSIGLSGTFTYCTLGDSIELDKILKGDILPDYKALGAVLFHMATNQTFDPSKLNQKKFYLGETEASHVWLIYKPDLDWLKSPEAALTLTQSKKIADVDHTKRHLVFASARYVSQKVLVEEELAVDFVPLPFALYRVDRS